MNESCKYVPNINEHCRQEEIEPEPGGWRHMDVFEYWFIRVVMRCCVAFKER
ncbi:BZ3500_MvSof-1268-A1-R1_Chr9g10747 [Microbotryum saponariae]|uniref:BZ3500_MvSof-1268-A1-R1_Chr9g10747 protein n=1 Tax=Microbotryum saponariae TaxID=289078 RepID=A0A2X0MFP9_9BASI|nr:BZ3501_MvSof-1269-A2-R1_Chr9g10495 [Microbotryum saponariae]SDA00621.1 BZ3500_MvSof-1268-A1-R1_Chr9g10747 [Microbotryum saponariae]